MKHNTGQKWVKLHFLAGKKISCKFKEIILEWFHPKTYYEGENLKVFFQFVLNLNDNENDIG